METFSFTPSYVYERSPEWRTLRTEFESGKFQTRAKWSSPRRRWHLVFSKISKNEAQQIVDFFNARKGRYEKFYWTCPLDNVQYTVYFDSDSITWRITNPPYIGEIELDFVEAK